MARTRRIKAAESAFYHITSRITGKQFLLNDPDVKQMMLDALARAAVFSGVKVGSFCIMDDHFHLLCHIPSSEMGTLPDDEFANRLKALYGKVKTERLFMRWSKLRQHGDTARVESEMARYKRRMHDLSEFVKTFKEEFRRAFAKKVEYSGRIWGDRFFSTLVEGAKYFSLCRAYIETNPVRAGICKRMDEYAWNTLGLAKRGNWFAKECLKNLRQISGDSPRDKWEERVIGLVVVRRNVQMTRGMILGSKRFVEESAKTYKEKIGTEKSRAREVAGEIYSSHGFVAAKRARNRGEAA
jgi:REP element-mobilizing transposase RayT